MSLWDLLDIDVQYKIIDKRDELNEYDTLFPKLAKDYLRNYIQTYLKSKGARLPDLSKATKKHLVGLFKTYNIPQVDHWDVVENTCNSTSSLAKWLICGKYKLPEVPTKTLNRPKSKFEVGKYTYT